MPIIDSQVHAYEANTPKRPWLAVSNWPPSATGDETVAAMDKLRIDGAIFISAFSMSTTSRPSSPSAGPSASPRVNALC